MQPPGDSVSSLAQRMIHLKDTNSEGATGAQLPVLLTACGCRQSTLVTFLLLRPNTGTQKQLWRRKDLFCLMVQERLAHAGEIITAGTGSWPIPLQGAHRKQRGRQGRGRGQDVRFQPPTKGSTRFSNLPPNGDPFVQLKQPMGHISPSNHSTAT